MKKDTNGLTIVESKNLTVRVMLVACLLVIVGFTYLGVSWQIANMLAGFTKPTDDNAVAVARSVAGMSTRDPLVAGLLAVAKQDSESSNVGLFEDVVRLAPRDYRWWNQLGRAYEQADMPQKAEAAFGYANKLAPNYVVPKWQAGNFYLRQGDDERALRIFAEAAPLDGVYRDQIFGVVWDYYDEDTKRLENIAGDAPENLAGLAKFYAAKKMPVESLRAWNRLDDGGRRKNAEVAKLIAQALYDRGYFRTSVQFVADLGLEKDVAVGKVTNGGFESDLVETGPVLFTWKTVKTEGVRIQTSQSNRRSGKRSLEVSFSGFNKPEINNIYQTVATKAGVRYRLLFWVKTERIASSGRPLVQIINAIDGKPLGASKAFDPGTKDWTEYSVEFTVPEDSEGIAIRTSREYCGESCVLTGSFFYDDFELVEID